MMKKKYAIMLLVTTVVMLGIPWLIVIFAESDAAMMIYILMLYGINPIYVLITGAVAGRNEKILWGFPFISAAMFLLGTWLAFEMGESVFVMYAGVYLGLSVMAMMISAIVEKVR